MNLTAFHDRSTRMSCAIPQCHRTILRSLYPDCTAIICGRCWRSADQHLRMLYAEAVKADKAFERAEMRATADRRPLRQHQAAMARDRTHRRWDACRRDAEIKAALGLEGTAGAPRGKRT